MSGNRTNTPDNIDWFFEGGPPPRQAHPIGGTTLTQPHQTNINNPFSTMSSATTAAVPTPRPFVEPPPPPPFPTTGSIEMEGGDIPPIPTRDRLDQALNGNREVAVPVDDLVAALYRSTELGLPEHTSLMRLRSPPIVNVLDDFFNRHNAQQNNLPVGRSVGSVPTSGDVRQVYDLCDQLRKQAPTGGRIRVRIVDEPITRMVASVTGGTKWYHAHETHTTNSYAPLYHGLRSRLDGEGDAIISKGLVIGCFIVPGFEPPTSRNDNDRQDNVDQTAASRSLASLTPSFGKVTLWIPREMPMEGRPLSHLANPPRVEVLDTLMRPTARMRPQRCKHCKSIVCGDESNLHLNIRHPELLANRGIGSYDAPPTTNHRGSPLALPPAPHVTAPFCSYPPNNNNNANAGPPPGRAPMPPSFYEPSPRNESPSPMTTPMSSTQQQHRQPQPQPPPPPPPQQQPPKAASAVVSSPSPQQPVTLLRELPNVPAAALVPIAHDAPAEGGPVVRVEVLESSPLSKPHPHVNGVPKRGAGPTYLPEDVMGVIGSMRFTRRVGKGGQGSVWGAELGNVQYAVKFTIHEAPSSEVFTMYKMHQEKLHHEHLIPYLCISRLKWSYNPLMPPSSSSSSSAMGSYYGTMIVMPYYGNGDLEQRIRQNRKDSLGSIAQWGLQLARVLRYLHGQRISWESSSNYRTSVNAHPVAHGDIKLANVLLCDDASQCVLMDLDNCQLLDPSALSTSASSRIQTRSSRVLTAPSTSFRASNNSDEEKGMGDTTSSSATPNGTYEWMAPEITARIDSPTTPPHGGLPEPTLLTPACDVWALGQLLFVMLCRSEELLFPHPVLGCHMSLNAAEWARFPPNHHFGEYGSIISRLDPQWGDKLRPSPNPNPLVCPLTHTLVGMLTRGSSLLASTRSGPSLFSFNATTPPLCPTYSRLVLLVVRMMSHSITSRPLIVDVEDQLSTVIEELIVLRLGS